MDDLEAELKKFEMKEDEAEVPTKSKVKEKVFARSTTSLS